MKSINMTWQDVLKRNFTKLGDLLHFLEITDQENSFFERKDFILNLPYRLAQKIEKNNPLDPLFIQFVPTKAEQNITWGLKDPVEDASFQLSQNLLQKYKRRALLVTTGACAMHCRYCFRQNYDYTPSKAFEKELSLLRADTSLLEVILSGGDPLSLPDRKLEHLITELNDIDHIKIIRFHTRFLIGIPERITPELLSILQNSKKQLIFVIHVNHAKELDSDVIQAIEALRKVGVTILCQSVLLKGVNDTLEALIQLCEKLICCGVIPYYLHQLDPVQGAHHFEVDIDKGKELVKQLRSHLPGYAVFQYVQELPHKESKTPL